MHLLSLPLELLRQVLSLATAPSLCRFAGTCHTADDLVVEELRFRYDSILRRFVVDRTGFRGVLGRTGSNVAGSSAALVCGIRGSYVPGDLDVYCDILGLRVVRDHLVGNEGYEEVSERARERYRPTSYAADEAERLIPVTGVDLMYDESLHRVEEGVENAEDEGSYAVDSEYMSGVANVVHLRRGEVYIDLISSSTPAATFPIIKFWSTVPMCFLTENGIHILYPWLQEENHVLLNPFRLPPTELDSPPPTSSTYGWATEGSHAKLGRKIHRSRV